MKRVILRLIDWIKSFFKKSEEQTIIDPFNRAEPKVRDYVFEIPDKEIPKVNSIDDNSKPKTILIFNCNDYINTVSIDGTSHKLTTKQFWLYHQFEKAPMHLYSGSELAKKFIKHKYLYYSQEEINSLPRWMKYYGPVLHRSMKALLKKELVIEVNGKFKFNGNTK